MKTMKPVIVGVLLVVWAWPTFAENDVGIEIELFEEIKEIDESGKEVVRQVLPENVVPGDTVVYVINFRNDGGEKIENAAITIPVPEHLRYIGGSAISLGGHGVKFSVDGGKSHHDKKRTLCDGEGWPQGVGQSG